MLVGHHNIPDAVAWAVSMVRVSFGDDIGNSRPGGGTGFWLSTTDGHTVFVTNRHVVDASLAFRGDKTLERMRVLHTEVHVRQGDATSLVYAPGRFFEVPDAFWLLHDAADVAILVDPKRADGPREDDFYKTYCLSESLLADGAWINTKLRMMDECFFVGYPSVKTADDKIVHFYDVPTNFPIARHAIVASGPFYKHESIETAGVMLVSGMSFHGSSGSPVITPFLGLPPGSASAQSSEPFPLVDAPALAVVGEHREPKLIGIMTGKFETKEIDRAFTHAGLSYFTRAGYISELLRKARDIGWKRAPG